MELWVAGDVVYARFVSGSSFEAFSSTKPKAATTPLTMPNFCSFYVYYITRNCREFRQVLENFPEKFTPVSGGPVHRKFSLRTENGPDPNLLMQSWELSLRNDTHMIYEWRLHGYPCISMAPARMECTRMHHACTCNMFTCRLPYALS